MNWPRADVLALLGIVVTVLLAGVPLAWKLTRGRVRRLAMWSGFPDRRYRKWFVGRYRWVDNPYLGRREHLDLGTTYVALSATGTPEEGEVRRVATKVIGDRKTLRLVIVGDPGSGKSTLLKAYGIGTLRARHGLEGADLRGITRSREVPFLVPLRDFAANLGKVGGDLRRYLIQEILGGEAGFPRDEGEAYLSWLLDKRRCLVLLDGLDEVPEGQYADVRRAIGDFAEDRTPGRATCRARMVLTCRRQNFLTIEGEWIPAFADQKHTISPLRDSEMFRYLRNLRGAFQKPQTPEAFLNAVRAAGMMELHRTPLILAMSVGLFLAKRTLEVPGSISKLYESLVRELLSRHDFQKDFGGRVNRFLEEDKYRFLQEFSLAMAQRPDAFQDFQRSEIVAAARQLAPSLRDLRPDDADDFVTEIVRRSGLLIEVARLQFTFAHRSIQEFLVAEELRGDFAAGTAFIAERAADHEWRQVAMFYAARYDKELGAFLQAVAGGNLALAVDCLAVADVPTSVAERLLDGLEARPFEPSGMRETLAAMLSACRSPRREIRNLATARAEALLIRFSPEEIAQWLGGDVNALEVLDMLSGTNAARIAALVPTLAKTLPADPRLVGILWRCLTAPGIEAEPACSEIVELLVTMVMDEDCLRELQRQPSYEPGFVTPELRRRAYPFERGLSRDANLVTVLAAAEALSVTPAKPNRFFEAKQADQRLFASVERDRRRTLRLSFFWPARVVTTALAIVPPLVVAFVAVTDPHLFLEPYGWWTPLVLLAPGLAALGIVLVGSTLAEYVASSPRVIDWLYEVSPEADLCGHVLPKIMSGAIYWVTLFGVPVLQCAAYAPLLKVSVPMTLTVSFLVGILGWWTPMLAVCMPSTHFYVFRPNRYVDMYADPASVRWLAPAE